MSGSAFEKRYGALFKSVERRKAEEEAEKQKAEILLAECRRRREEEKRKKTEMRIVENDERLCDYQQTAVKEILAAWQEKKNVMLQMPTGTGVFRKPIFFLFATKLCVLMFGREN